jgi:hypothetical protein
MDDVPLRVELVGEEGDSCSTSCSTGSCSTPKLPEAPVQAVVDLGDEWLLNVPEPLLDAPVVLATHLARALGLVFVLDTRSDSVPVEAPLEVTAELASVALGFGVLLLEGSHIYQKSCGGPSVRRFTAMEPAELAVPFGLFVRLGRHPTRAAFAELSVTQKALVTEALELLDSNHRVIDRLSREPSRVGEGVLELAPARTWLARVFSGLRRRTSAEDSLDELEAELSAEAPRRQAPKPRDPKRDELRALVEEALPPRPGAE